MLRHNLENFTNFAETAAHHVLLLVTQKPLPPNQQNSTIHNPLATKPQQQPWIAVRIKTKVHDQHVVVPTSSDVGTVGWC